MNGTNPMDASYQAFRDQLRPNLPDELVIEDYLRRLAYGTDASFYRLIPKLVVKVRDEADLTRVLGAADRHQVPVTFRAAGTSLSGQAVTDSVLVVLDGRAWQVVLSTLGIRSGPAVGAGTCRPRRGTLEPASSSSACRASARIRECLRALRPR